MAEPLSNINDAGSPISGSYRRNTADGTPMPQPLPGTPLAVEPDRLLSEGERNNPRLNAAAERVGGAMGSAVGSVRRGLRVVGGRRSGRLSEMADPKGRISDLADSASATAAEIKDSAAEKFADLKERASDLSQRAGERLEEFKSSTGERMSDLADTMKDRVHYARHRVNYVTEQYPIQTILGFAGLAFVIGFALRIWRSNGD